MAIYNFAGTVISRSQGRSAIASAAYRSGEKLYDERQERSMNYSRKQDVIFKEILLPANAPLWMSDREKLWNAVEKAETRVDAQLAREFNFALPREFSKEQNIAVAKEFVQEQFVSRGMIADLCIHTGRTKDGAEQPHAHVMLTMREVNHDGFGLKERSWNAKENIMLWREAWAEYLNKYLALNGIDKRVDHRSLADQGISLIPQIKIGSVNLKDHARRLEEYQRIACENGEKLLADPNIALRAITHHQSTFTHRDIARFVNGHTADVTQFQAVLEKVKASDQIVLLGKDERNTERFTTREMLVLEQKMLKDVEGLENKGHGFKFNDNRRTRTTSLQAVPSLTPLAPTSRDIGIKPNVGSMVNSSFRDAETIASIKDSNSIEPNGAGAVQLHITPNKDFPNDNSAKVSLSTTSSSVTTSEIFSATTSQKALIGDLRHYSGLSNRMEELAIPAAINDGSNVSNSVNGVRISKETAAATELLGSDVVDNGNDKATAAADQKLGDADSSFIGIRSVEQNSVSHDITLSLQQKHALEHIMSPGSIKCLIGYAGTGKSHILKEAKEIWEENGYSIHGATLSGIAAENLEGASGINSRTLASRCYYWDTGRQLLTEKDILVIDEAGMLGTRQMARVIDEVKTHGAKLVLIGDPQQLQAIEAGAAFRAITAKTSYMELTEVRRQLEPWQQEATKEFALRDVKAAISRYDERDHIHSFDNQSLAKTSLVEMWNDVRISQPDKTQIMLAYTRKDAQELNELAREYRKQNNELGEDYQLLTSTGNKSFAEGDRIYFLRNNRDLGVMNGTLGTIESITDNKLTVVTDKDDFEGNKHIINFDLDSYSYITHGYAATIHKAQGVTVDRSYILASKHLDSHAAYVGMSRHRESADLFWSKEEFNDENALLHTLSRDRSKDIALDYIHDPAKEDLNESLSLEDSLESRINRIVKECTKLVDSIDYCSTKQEEFIKSGTFSPFMKECIEENTASIKQCLNDSKAGNKEVLSYLKQNEAKLYSDINRVCSNILSNTLKSIESKELLTNLTKDQPALYEKVIAVENKYEDLRQECIEKEQLTKEKADNWSEYTRYLDMAEKAEKHLEKYANDICKDMAITQLISKHDPDLFNEMNKRFDDMFTNVLKQHETHENFIREIHPELSDRTLSDEERFTKMHEQYEELKQEYVESEEATYLKAENWSEYEQRIDDMEEIEEHLDCYIKEACKDKDFMDYLSNHDEKTFNEMNERFNELVQEQMQEIQKELERDI